MKFKTKKKSIYKTKVKLKEDKSSDILGFNFI